MLRWRRRRHGENAKRLIVTVVVAVEEEECTLTLASDGSTHHETGETCPKVATYLWPRAERETSRRCGGEPLRPGRIGESGDGRGQAKD